ncbi:MAG: GNAT family N-acetyltransferase [Bacteroides sp.]|nr:GNAT family N-acetyltransferase [Bacteroides sp.]MCM1550271.1 GNAT family N-acetyltransferase [Clostridium sp.]
MEIQKAKPENLKTIARMVQQTIQQVYPKYYPDGVVQFFSELHQEEHIIADIEKGCVWILQADSQIVATGTLVENHITRVFVLPEYQGKGYGSRLMEVLERQTAENNHKVCLDASLPAVAFYAGRGYRTISHGTVETNQSQVLIYEIMEKPFQKHELRLRPYRIRDGAFVASWMKDEYSFYQWSADRINQYPLTPEILNAHYAEYAAYDTVWEMTAMDEEGIPRGHFIMRYPEENREILRFGFIIVDSELRGLGYGKAMLNLAIRYAFDLLHVRKITLGVFENNSSALHCYRGVGFQVMEGADCEYRIGNETWNCIEMELTREIYDNK